MKQIWELGFTPSDVCFWSGAGISVEKPSNLLLGDQLTKQIIDRFCLDCTRKRVSDYMTFAAIADAQGNPKKVPRLEVVLQAVVEILGFEALNCLEMFDRPENFLHRFFAWHLSNGGTHITMNFDNCIAKARDFMHRKQGLVPGGLFDDPKEPPQSVSTYHNHLVHLHGRFVANDLKKLRQLGVTIGHIQSGFDNKVKEKLRELISCKKVLVFLGYSGRDYFDVDPFFKELEHDRIDLTNLTVIWVKHNSLNDIAAIEPYHHSRQKRLKKNVLESLSKCGANVWVSESITKKFITELSTIWRVHSGVYEEIDSNISVKSSFERLPPVRNEFRVIITSNLYRAMGIGKEVESLSASVLNALHSLDAKEKSLFGPHSHLCLQNQILYIINEGLRETGYYRKSNRILSEFVRCDLNQELFRLKRIAGGYWLMGNVCRSQALFHKAMALGKELTEASDNNDREWSKELRFAIDMRYLHWYRDTLRIPIINKILSPDIAIDTFMRVLSQEDLIRASPYDQAHLKRLYEEIPFLKKHIKLPDFLAGIEERPETVFIETDNILGVINYTRNAIQKKLANDEQVTTEELNLLFKRCQLIGDRAGILKCFLIMRRLAIRDKQANKEAIRALREIEWTVFRKLQWLVAFLTCGRKFI